MSYTELHITTNFSFLRGASHPDELADHAAALGYKEIAITDRNSFAGIVRAHAAGKKSGIRIIPACRLDLQDGMSLLAYPTNIQAYSQLTNLLTLGNRRAEKGHCLLYQQDVFEHSANIIFIALPPLILDEQFDLQPGVEKALSVYKEVFKSNLRSEE